MLTNTVTISIIKTVSFVKDCSGVKLTPPVFRVMQVWPGGFEGSLVSTLNIIVGSELHRRVLVPQNWCKTAVDPCRITLSKYE